jgi:hypothetical protein
MGMVASRMIKIGFTKIMKALSLAVGLTLYLATCPICAAEKVNTYQVTGPIVELTATKIVVQKNDEKWEIARDPATKVEGDLKVGAKVTVQYRMTAAKVEVKGNEKTTR